MLFIVNFSINIVKITIIFLTYRKKCYMISI